MLRKTHLVVSSVLAICGLSGCATVSVSPDVVPPRRVVVIEAPAPSPAEAEEEAPPRDRSRTTTKAPTCPEWTSIESRSPECTPQTERSIESGTSETAEPAWRSIEDAGSGSDRDRAFDDR
jgi:hypothetical protein